MRNSKDLDSATAPFLFMHKVHDVRLSLHDLAKRSKIHTFFPSICNLSFKKSSQAHTQQLPG